MSIAIATTKYLTLLFTLCDLRKNANQKTRLMNSWVLCSFLVRTSCNVKHTRKDFKRKRKSVLFKAPVCDIAGRTAQVEIAACITKYHEDLCGKGLDSRVWRIDSVDK